MERHILGLQILMLCASAGAVTLDTAQIGRKKIDPKHSNIYIQKITNESDKGAFVALERTYVIPLEDRIDLSGHLMPGKDFQLNDPSGAPYATAVPIWQKTFRGNTFNVVTLSGNPGRIYYLYTIDGHLWAIKAPIKEGDLKGIHLLDPSETDRKVELKILDDNVLSVALLEDKKAEPAKTGARTPVAQSRPVQNRTAPQTSASRQRLTAPQVVQNNNNHRPAQRHDLPKTTRAQLRDNAPS